MKIVPVLGLLSLVTISSFSALPVQAAVLIGNTTGDNVVEIDEKTGKFLGEFIPALWIGLWAGWAAVCKQLSLRPNFAL